LEEEISNLRTAKPTKNLNNSSLILPLKPLDVLDMKANPLKFKAMEDQTVFRFGKQMQDGGKCSNGKAAQLWTSETTRSLRSPVEKTKMARTLSYTTKETIMLVNSGKSSTPIRCQIFQRKESLTRSLVSMLKDLSM
jgi:hypothetical protein